VVEENVEPGCTGTIVNTRAKEVFGIEVSSGSKPVLKADAK
jgi:hypothetical protein